MTLTPQELATVLAALRTVQCACAQIGPLGTNGAIRGAFSSMPHFDEVEPLTVTAIDELCERLNVAEDDPDGLTAEQRESLRDRRPPGQPG